MSSVHIVREDASGIELSHARLLGPVFVFVGGAMVYFGLLRPEDDTVGRWMLGGMGAIFAVIGILGTLWRYELKLDLMSRTYLGRRGFWPSPKLLQGSLDELRGIVIEQIWSKSSSDSGSSEHPEWVLSFDFGDWSVRFFQSRNEARAFAKLEQLARTMQVHALDRTGDTEIRRAWNELDRSVAESLRASGTKPVDPGAPPGGSRILWEPASGIGSVVLPATGITRATIAVVLIGMVITGFGAAVLGALTGIWDVPYSGSRVAGWVLGSVFFSVGLFLVLGAVWAGFAREVAREERDGLLFFLVAFGRRYRRRFIAKREIEEVALKPVATARKHRLLRKKTPLAVPRGRGTHEVVVRSDDVLVKMGADVGPEEQDWVVRAVTYLATRE